MASTDKLTGLLNRHGYAMLIGHLMAAYRREGEPITVLMVDVDFFKAINDKHGHQIGDGALFGVAKTIKSILREADFAVRWGGEEFLVLLPGCNRNDGRIIAEKLRLAIETAYPCPSLPSLRVTISVGLSQFDGAESIERTIKRADGALYKAKERGRNVVCVAEEATQGT